MGKGESNCLNSERIYLRKFSFGVWSKMDLVLDLGAITEEFNDSGKDA